MVDAKAMLGAAGERVQLLGVDANPKATAIDDVLSYTQLHGMLRKWQFLTGSLAQLRAGLARVRDPGAIAARPDRRTRRRCT